MKSLFTYSDLQELAGYREKALLITTRLSEIFDTVVGSDPSNKSDEDLRKEAKVLDCIVKESNDIADKIDFLLNYDDVSEKNIDESFGLFQKSIEVWKK